MAFAERPENLKASKHHRGEQHYWNTVFELLLIQNDIVNKKDADKNYRYKQYKQECADEREANSFHTALIWNIARISFKNGFKRGDKWYLPLDIVLADDNNFYWLVEDGKLLEISDDDIFGEGGYVYVRK